MTDQVRDRDEPWLQLPELDEMWGPDSPVAIAKALECAEWAIRHGRWDEAVGLLGRAEIYSGSRRNLMGMWEQAKVGLAWCCWKSGNKVGSREHLKDAIKSWVKRSATQKSRNQVFKGNFEPVSDLLQRMDAYTGLAR